MSNNETIKEIGSHYRPLTSFLKGSYAYSYTSFWRAIPPYKIEIPQLGSFYESPAKSGKFEQVSGYSLACYAAYIHFNGDGTFYEKGMVNRGGVDISPRDNVGTYTVEADWQAGVFTGRFTVTVPPNSAELIDHYFVMANDWKELHFIMLDAKNFDPNTNAYKNFRMPLAAGILKRINN